MSNNNNPLHGIHAATVCPLKEDGKIDNDALALHQEHISNVEGINGLLINGHAGEGGLLNFDEKRLVVETAKATLHADKFICAGITSESTQGAIIEAQDAAKAGADALLVFPPNAWALGHDNEMVQAHHKAIAQASGLPIVLYRSSVFAGKSAYTLDTIKYLLEIDAVIGIKEGSWEVAAYEEVRKLTKSIRAEVAVLASGDEHLLTGYLIGSEGSQVSLAAIVPELVAALFEASKNADWARAKILHDCLYPLSVAIYRRTPSYMATPRLKTCLKLQNILKNDGVKLPSHPTYQCDYNELSEALAHSVI